MLKQDALQKSLSELYGGLKTSENGLSEEEAANRLKISGPNILRGRGVSAWKVLLRQLQTSLVYLLVAASGISYWIRDYSDGTVILAILLINTALGFSQEFKSEKTIEKLSKFISHQVLLRRSGRIVLVDESQVVAGDALVVREGDIAPADMRLFEATSLQINESQLTGESVPVSKRISVDPGKSSDCLVFAGSIIEKGEGIGIVYATGNDTELGTIAKLSTEIKKETQYGKSLRSFSSFLMRIALLGLALIFVFKLIINGGFSDITDLFLFVIAMAVAVVPEVLPVIATVTMANGSLKLAKKQVVVRRLSSLEDLGNVNLLCTDKTGTLTENKMTVENIAATNERLFQLFAYAAITPLKGRKRRTQNSYDDAFIRYIAADIKKEANDFKILKEIPFDPGERRRRVLLEDTARKKQYLLSIGAPEALFTISGDEKEKTRCLKDIAKEGQEGFHHLAIAYKEVSPTADFDVLENEHNLSFLGYVSLKDPLRPTAKNTIKLAEKLGIGVKILTGDGREVAEYVGREVGLIGEEDRVYLGSEMEDMPEDEFKETVRRFNVFARVSPEQKFKIIETLKETYVVGYQGDGINDAPALKLADVAIAVNSATDITKENADIVLLNRSLEVIINGIKYGRSVFVDINKYIRYTMISNWGNFIALSVLYLLSTNLPMLPVQVLLTSLITDIPLITVSSDTVDDTEVAQPEKQNIRELMFISLLLGIPTALFEIFYFLIIRSQPLEVVATSLYLFLTFMALIVFYSIRTKKYFWKAKQPSHLLSISFASAFLFSLGIIYVPQFQNWFSFVPLSAMAVAAIVILATFYLLTADFIKVRYYNLSGTQPR